MSSIRILSDRVANQIAAGEVIERPVAVVKELVENSIDAGATRIEIEFRNGGKSYIRIEDNGKGMPPDEALLSLERHATSKIREAADLNDILSFGFRGEALPSIASVSKFRMRTRSQESEHGTEIFINGGKLIDKKDCGMPVGTVIEVSNLFNSVPARRKFLKTDPTETAHITYTCRLFAVAHPSIAFRVLDTGRVVFQSPACNDLSDRIAEIWGRQMAADLIPVSAEDPDRHYRLSGLTAKPGVGRSTRRELITLVNRRPIDSRTLGFAVLDAYHGQIQKGRFPPAFLFFEIRPQEVDVNVHPAKREIRFRDDGSVRRFILNAISETLAAERAKMQPSAPAIEVTQPEMPMPQATTRPSPPKPAVAPKAAQPKAIVPAPATHQSPQDRPEPPQSAKPKQTASQSQPAPQPTSKPQPVAEPTPEPRPPTPAPADTNAKAEVAPSPAADFSWKFVAIFQKQYALFDTPRGLVMMHIRHADQRVRFERIRQETENNSAPSQTLLIPIPLELEPLANDVLRAQIDLLARNGFGIEAFGRNFYRIESIPTWIAEDRAESFIRDLIDQIRHRGSQRQANEVAWETIARLAVAGSYRRSDSINENTVQKLAQDLLQTDVPHASPFGKPTFHEISWNEWGRKLGAD